ncbi:MAG: gamma-glutamyl-gamma-aminobutyrate hydrolase family protein [Lachnospiraceae bacterium]|nr:gamma-glutamyl-gamma-aminobutyrate hydrolase family protein [Lachnospiraceae bacterium]
MRIAILGKKADTVNYVKYVQTMGAIPSVTLSMGEVACCNALLLPGGGDITPAFFGEKNHGSRNIDTELDILQLQALDLAVRKGLPVLGICKGLQIINVGFGGTLTQDMELQEVTRHGYDNGDKYHSSIIVRNSWLYPLYGDKTTVNSAHHQAISKLGNGLAAVQHCPEDQCIEAITHQSLPIIGVQWHPERIDENRSGINGLKVLDYFSSLISASVQI